MISCLNVLILNVSVELIPSSSTYLRSLYFSNMKAYSCVLIVIVC